MKLLVSLIIPAYNDEATIERCLQSVADQVADDNAIEIVVVNDGSTDCTAERINAFSDRHPDMRMVLVNQPNGGVSDARNTGINAATGRYITFLDSDDYWLPGYWKAIRPLAEHCGADIIEYDARLVNEAGRTILDRRICLAGNGRHVVDEAMLMRYADAFYNYLWSRLWRAELFASIRFPAGRRYEDAGTMPWLYAEASSLYCHNQPLIAYTQRTAGSITSTPRLADVRDLNEIAVRAFRSASEGPARAYWLRIAQRTYMMSCALITRLPARARAGACLQAVRAFPKLGRRQIGVASWARLEYPILYIAFLSVRHGLRRRQRRQAPALQPGK
jgi:glycosyltransferase involved in cell wall biosynthesis